jgi:hypothetical protein
MCVDFVNGRTPDIESDIERGKGIPVVGLIGRLHFYDIKSISLIKIQRRFICGHDMHHEIIDP